MVRQERYALFNLSIAAVAVAAFAALIPAIGMTRAQAAFSLLALIALGPFIYRRRGDQVVGDERDRAIHLRATQITFGILWILFVAGMLSTYFLGGRHVGELLILIVWLGTATLLICHSAVLLILYRRS